MKSKRGHVCVKIKGAKEVFKNLSNVDSMRRRRKDSKQS